LNDKVAASIVVEHCEDLVVDNDILKQVDSHLIVA